MQNIHTLCAALYIVHAELGEIYSAREKDCLQHVCATIWWG